MISANVLAVMDDAYSALRLNSCDIDNAVAMDRLDQARSAVAELMDAAQEFSIPMLTSENPIEKRV